MIKIYSIADEKQEKTKITASSSSSSLIRQTQYKIPEEVSKFLIHTHKKITRRKKAGVLITHTHTQN